ncbi:transposase [Flavobacterium sp. HJJ]|uniref:transposase n=1 Tax=Flavobacterium sp. HJJ TaxID=2783792 RepID=UPI00188A0CA8|nr:transposase [Flavobacterium sp. HJJ]MBF4472510.1 transposase [Flavobacterium sp. HJJ]
MKNRKRNRMQGFDYSTDNLYFVTICVKDRVCCLGAVVDVGAGRDLSVPNINELDIIMNSDEFIKKMELNEFGKIVKNQIEWLAEQYKYVDVHNFVIMPNHVHMVIEIDKKKLTVGTGRDKIKEGTARKLSVQDNEIKIKSLSSLIGAFKTTSSKMMHHAGFADFAWQRSFHDHIIRNERSYQNISNYIDLNPEKWMADTFFEKH